MCSYTLCCTVKNKKEINENNNKKKKKRKRKKKQKQKQIIFQKTFELYTREVYILHTYMHTYMIFNILLLSLLF